MGKTDLNFKGIACPMPIIKLSTAVRKGGSGDVFEATCDDPAFEQDIRSWCHQTGNVLSEVRKAGSDIIAVITKR